MLNAWIRAVVVISAGAAVAAAQDSGPPSRSFLPRSVPSSRAKPQTAAAPASDSSAPREGEAGATPPQTPLRRSVQAAAVQNAEPVSVLSTKDPVKYKRAVYRLKTIPASDAARTLDQVFRAEGKHVLQGSSPQQVIIVADARANSLVVSGSPQAVEEVAQLVQKLDHTAAMVRLEVVIGEAPADLGAPAHAGGAKSEPAKKPEGQQLQASPKPEQMQVLLRGELTTLDNQPAFLKVGGRESRVTGSHVSPTGTMNSVTMEEVGTTVGVTPRVGPDKAVIMEVDIKDSRFGPAEEGVPISIPKDGKPIRSPNLETLTSRTTVHVASGQTVTLAGTVRQAGAVKQRFILITPHVLPIGGEGR